MLSPRLSLARRVLYEGGCDDDDVDSGGEDDDDGALDEGVSCS